MKRKLILHIGTEKTGTSSLQEFFHLNRCTLIDKGIYYTKCLGEKNNRVLPSIFMDDNHFDDFFKEHGISTQDDKKKYEINKKKELHVELTSLDERIHTVIISSEHFHSRLKSRDSVAKLASYLNHYFDDIKVVSYLREQSELVMSLYSTILKSGTCVDLPEFANNACVVKNDYYNYELFLSKWEMAFGIENILVRIFDKQEFYKNDLLLDFLNILGVSGEGFDFNIHKTNESLSPLGQILQKMVNKTFPRYLDGLGLNARNVHLSHFISNNFSGKGELLERELQEEIRSRFIASNNNICNKYFSNRETLFSYGVSFQAPINTNDAETEKLMKFFSLFRDEGELLRGVPDHYADILRDSAMDYEEKDMNKSYHLMKLAHEIRPTGPVIKSKLLEYSRRCFRK